MHSPTAPIWSPRVSSSDQLSAGTSRGTCNSQGDVDQRQPPAGGRHHAARTLHRIGVAGPEDDHRPITLAGADRHAKIGQPDGLFLAAAVEPKLDHVAVEARRRGRRQRGEPARRCRLTTDDQRSSMLGQRIGGRRDRRQFEARPVARSTARRSLRRRLAPPRADSEGGWPGRSPFKDRDCPHHCPAGRSRLAGAFRRPDHADQWLQLPPASPAANGRHSIDHAESPPRPPAGRLGAAPSARPLPPARGPVRPVVANVSRSSAGPRSRRGRGDVFVLGMWRDGDARPSLATGNGGSDSWLRR